jgi:hypothetical protein
MEITCFSETSVDFQRTTRRYIADNGTLHNHRCEKLKSYIWHFPYGFWALYVMAILRSRREAPWMAGMMELEMSSSPPTGAFPSGHLWPVSTSSNILSQSYHNFRVKRMARQQGNAGKYLGEGSIRARGGCGGDNPWVLFPYSAHQTLRCPVRSASHTTLIFHKKHMLLFTLRNQHVIPTSQPVVTRLLAPKNLAQIVSLSLGIQHVPKRVTFAASLRFCLILCETFIHKILHDHSLLGCHHERIFAWFRDRLSKNMKNGSVDKKKQYSTPIEGRRVQVGCSSRKHSYSEP